ncbi:MAG: FtsX-like permease family protein [Acidobacteriota bacterium]
MKLIGLVLANFKRHKLRTLLTMLSIVVAFILFAYLSAIKKGFEMGVSVAGADRLVVRHKISLIQPLPQSYQAQIDRMDGITLSSQASWFGGLYRDKQVQWAQIAVEPEKFTQIYTEFLIPPEQKKAWFETRTGAVAGRKTAERFGWKVGDKITLQATFNRPKVGNTWTFDLVGIYDGAHPEVDTTAFWFRHDYLNENRLYGDGITGWYYIKIKDPKNAESIARKIDEQFANSPAETKTETEKAFIKGFAEQVGNIGAIVTAILTAVFFTILLVAGNTMAQAVRERVGELGVLKAIGFTDGQVLALVLIESLLISMIAGGVGILLGWMFVSAGDPTGGALPVFFFAPRSIVTAAVLAVLLGIVTGALPAFQAMRLNPVEALRRE